jgi:hypothetical protein
MSSSVPNAVNAFINLATITLGPNATVWFGKPLGVYEQPITLQILGVSEGEQTIETMGPDYMRDELYNIECQLSSWAGDPMFVNRMNEVFNNFSLLTVAVGNNPTLNQTVRFAQIHSFTYVPGTDAKGMTCGELSFAVACQARISSLT